MRILQGHRLHTCNFGNPPAMRGSKGSCMHHPPMLRTSLTIMESISLRVIEKEKLLACSFNTSRQQPLLRTSLSFASACLQNAEKTV
eukprot:1158787-Pelagomonas_calceolata.AAC.2